jgi:hypothetical protein
MKLLILLLILLVTTTLHAQDSTFTGLRNTPAALLFLDKGKEIARLTDRDFTGRDTSGTVFIKNYRGWYIVDSIRAWPVLMRVTELYLNIKSAKP